MAVPFNDRIYVLGGQYFDESGKGHVLNINEIFHIVVVKKFKVKKKQIKFKAFKMK